MCDRLCYNPEANECYEVEEKAWQYHLTDLLVLALFRRISTATNLLCGTTDLAHS